MGRSAGALFCGRLEAFTGQKDCFEKSCLYFSLFFCMIERTKIKEGFKEGFKMQCHALKGKTILFLGSSVTYGSAADGFSFVDELAAKTGCHAIKEAVSGTTLADLDVQSYVRRLKRVDPALFPDLFVCQLSTNDASQNVPLGRPDAPDADARTVAGAVRTIVGLARERWRCPVAFYTNPRYDSASYQEMVDVLHILADAMQFSVIDLWNDMDFNRITPQQRRRFMADEIHPTKAGYREWWTPVFERELARLLLNDAADGTAGNGGIVCAGI